MEGGPSGGCAGPSGCLSAGGVDGLDSGEVFADRSSEGEGGQGFVEEEGRQEQTGGGRVDEEQQHQGADAAASFTFPLRHTRLRSAFDEIDNSQVDVIYGAVSSSRNVSADAF